MDVKFLAVVIDSLGDTRTVALAGCVVILDIIIVCDGGIIHVIEVDYLYRTDLGRINNTGEFNLKSPPATLIGSPTSYDQFLPTLS